MEIIYEKWRIPGNLYIMILCRKQQPYHFIQISVTMLWSDLKVIWGSKHLWLTHMVKGMEGDQSDVDWETKILFKDAMLKLSHTFDGHDYFLG